MPASWTLLVLLSSTVCSLLKASQVVCFKALAGEKYKQQSFLYIFDISTARCRNGLLVLQRRHGKKTK
jgi:hypothetical protein